MGKISLSNLDLLQVRDHKDGIHYGCHQEWYADQWQRRSGCGPSVACNLISYLDATKKTFGSSKPIAKMDECLMLMDEVWDYVTPSDRGIPHIHKFYEPFLLYTGEKGAKLELHHLEIPEEGVRPDFKEVVSFIKEGLLQDVPIAFLNLCNGKEENLDRWHWVTLVELEEKDNISIVKIIDEGVIKIINLSLWYETTTLGGGFVYFLEKGRKK